MKITTLIFFITASFTSYAAKTVYVTDKLEILLRSGQGTEFKIITSLETGTPLTVLKTDKVTGWTKVKSDSAEVGWVLTRFLTEEPVASILLESTTKKMNDLNVSNTKINDALESLRASNTQSKSEMKSLTTEKNKLLHRLNTVKDASANAVRILNERDHLQERVINLERELQKTKRDKQTLQDSSSQDWFMKGAGVLFAGMILGLVLPKLSWKRKANSWDSF